MHVFVAIVFVISFGRQVFGTSQAAVICTIFPSFVHVLVTQRLSLLVHDSPINLPLPDSSTQTGQLDGFTQTPSSRTMLSLQKHPSVKYCRVKIVLLGTTYKACAQKDVPTCTNYKTILTRQYL